LFRIRDLDEYIHSHCNPRPKEGGARRHDACCKIWAALITLLDHGPFRNAPPPKKAESDIYDRLFP
jgi:hypothetical protein